MGSLSYSNAETRIDIEDRVLAHLKVVMVAKLRRSEPYLFTWHHEDGRSESLWFHPSIPLHFSFDDDEPAQLNAIWLEALMISANSGGGLRLVDESQTPATVPEHAARASARRRSTYRSISVGTNGGAAPVGAGAAA